MLPEAKIFDLLSSVGNGENKALELIVMREGVIYSSYYLWKEVMNHQGNNPGWRMGLTVPFGHCEDSLSPIGLVTKEALSPDGTAWGYEITQYGLRTGVPFAGLLLKWSHDHPNYSLYKMFASTASSAAKNEQTLDKKRAQETRFKIFWEIATYPSKRIRRADIVHETGENQAIISRYLADLAKNGIISYEASEHGKPIAYYKLKETIPDKEPEPYFGWLTLTARVYEIIKQDHNGYLPGEQIANLLIKDYPEYEKLKRKSLVGSIAGILSHLVEQGYAERQKFIGSQFLSELTLSDKQKEATVSLITLIDKFKTGDAQTTMEGRAFAQRLLVDPNLFSHLMLKAKEASPFANRTDREEMSSILLSILQDYPNSTVNQILQILEKDHGKAITPRGLRRNLFLLLKHDLIASDKTKSGNIYRLADGDAQADLSGN